MRRKIVTMTVVIALLVLGLFAAPSAVLVAKYLVDDERGEVTTAADLAALSATADFARGRTPTLLRPPQSDIVVAFYGPAGTRVTGTGPDVADAEVRSALAGNRVANGDPGGDFVVDSPVIDDGTVVGAVRARSSRLAAWTPILSAWLVMAVLAAATLTAAWFVARRQAGRLAAPLEELSGAAAGIGYGHWDAPDACGVPEIDHVAAGLARSAHRVERTLARERAFSADSSHQLRTPLAGLRLQLETALEGPDTGLRQAITTAIGAADVLDRTINDLLALSRDTQAGERALPLTTLIDDLRADHHEALATAGRRLTVVTTHDLPPAAASAPAMRQVIGVLLDNALRHGRGTVTVTARETTQALAVDVADEGRLVGSPQLFVRRSPTAAGHGIGLALARSLTEAEGGRLLLSGEHPTTFTVLLPLAAGHEQHERA